jgi:hypothetical protein
MELNTAGAAFPTKFEELHQPDVQESSGPPTDNVNYISKLPEEILRMVIEDIPREDLKAFLALSLTNQVFHRLSTEHVYAKFHHEIHDRSCDSTRFIRTVFDDPRLGKNVKEVMLDPFSAQKPPYLEEDRLNLLEYLGRLHLPDHDKWAKGLKRRHHADEIELALIMSQTPGIEELLVLGPFSLGRAARHRLKRTPPPWLLPIIRSAQNQPYGDFHDFTSLQKMSINVLGFRFSAISPLFQLPSLRILELEQMSDQRPWECLADSSPIQALHFSKCRLSKRSVEPAILACRSLASFVVHDQQGIHATDSWIIATIGFLKKHKTSLNHLHLQRHRTTGPFAASTLPKELASFRDFTELQYLLCPLSPFLRDIEAPSLAEILPPNLKFLGLWLNNFDRHGPQFLTGLLKNFAISYARGLPHLAALRIESFTDWLSRSIAWEDVAEIFQRARFTYTISDVRTGVVHRARQRQDDRRWDSNGKGAIVDVRPCNDIVATMFDMYSQQYTPYNSLGANLAYD